MTLFLSNPLEEQNNDLISFFGNCHVNTTAVQILLVEVSQSQDRATSGRNIPRSQLSLWVFQLTSVTTEHGQKP